MLLQDQIVSIRAPARGATKRRAASVATIDPGFNPRPRTGGDNQLGTCEALIRAPARGATFCLMV